MDPHVQGSDPARLPTNEGNKSGIKIPGGMGASSMSNGTGNNNDADLPGGDTTGGGGSSGSSKGSSSGSSSGGGAGG
jgi:hypothetical protein